MFCFPFLTKADDAYISQINVVPDYVQTDLSYGGLPGGGTQYCAPVAVSNSLMWLDANGFSSLVPNSPDRKEDQFDLAKLLGSSTYLNTNLIDGTGANAILEGVKKYIIDKGYEYTNLKYQGWRYHSTEFSAGSDVPSLDWIKTGIKENGSVWLNVGWYDYNAAANEYSRIGGHWVTLVGYGHNGVSVDPNYLIVHDPSPRAGYDFANEYILISSIDSGKLAGNYFGLPRPAVGFLKISGGMHIKSTADYCILDGVIVLDMPQVIINNHNPFNPSIMLQLLLD